jgi:hypothetical protein
VIETFVLHYPHNLIDSVVLVQINDHIFVLLLVYHDDLVGGEQQIAVEKQDINVV